MTDITDSLNTILKMCRKNEFIPNLKCGTLTARAMTGEIEKVSSIIQNQLISRNINLDNFNFSVSYGHGYFTKSPWVGIVEVGRKVSNSLSVCICFDKGGKGIVLGVMSFRVHKFGKYKTIERSENDLKKVPLVGASIRSQYSHKFFNPLTLSIKELESKKIIEHIESSISLMKNIKEEDDPYLYR